MNAYKEELANFLENNYRKLGWAGATVESKHGGKFETVSHEEGDSLRWQVIQYMVTKAPDGKLYAWDYVRGLTEMQEDDYYSDELQEVEEYTEVIEVRKYRAKD